MMGPVHLFRVWENPFSYIGCPLRSGDVPLSVLDSRTPSGSGDLPKLPETSLTVVDSTPSSSLPDLGSSHESPLTSLVSGRPTSNPITILYDAPPLLRPFLKDFLRCSLDLLHISTGPFPKPRPLRLSGPPSFPSTWCPTSRLPRVVHHPSSLHRPPTLVRVVCRNFDVRPSTYTKTSRETDVAPSI